MNIQELKDKAFLEAVKELKDEYSNDLEALKKIEKLENEREKKMSKT